MFENYKGKNGASKYWQELFDAFPNIKINIITLTSNSDRIVAEIDVSGIQKGKIGSSPSSGDKFHIRGAFVYKFSQRTKIGEIRMYYDSSILKRQLNMLRIQGSDTTKNKQYGTDSQDEYSWKTAEVGVIAKKGKSYRLTRSFLQKFRDDQRNISTRIDIRNNITAIFIYKDSKELSDIYADIRGLSDLKSVKSYVSSQNIMD